MNRKPSYLYEQISDLITVEPLVYTVLSQQNETGEPDMQAAIRLIRALVTKSSIYKDMVINEIEKSVRVQKILAPTDPDILSIIDKGNRTRNGEK